jgi:ADP-heptose:LPS heptosyltransferase
MSGRPRLLALRALGLGDLLTAVPALRALADAFPEHRRILATPAALAPLAAMTRAVDETVAARPLAPLPAALAGVDVAVNLHGSGPESHRVLAALEPGRLIAFANTAAGVAGPSWRADEHEVSRWCRLLSESGIAADPDRLDLEPVWLDPRAAGATVIHPGAASRARRWPAERFARVALAEQRAGRRVVITGSPEEAALGRAVGRWGGVPPRHVLSGRTDLEGLAAVVAAADRVVCGDTGVAHLATALGTPSVVLFGPTSPAAWGPPPGRPQHRVIWPGGSGDPHGPEVDPGLAGISTAQVLAALADLPRRAPVPA